MEGGIDERRDERKKEEREGGRKEIKKGRRRRRGERWIEGFKKVSKHKKMIRV